ncbi:penicillin-binding protein 1C [Neolewinella lacunae]|uniref:penicillin-binding protein 1C n=1 Tax=Neolewinella lacunae TaxID=1517758 RepID=UPI001FE56E7D|nr:penicillin-binding protein 1C [Neolewinella lacunae]MDN3633083.1 penicillin-binding protein 1C [Neolewinella lacunae]
MRFRAKILAAFLLLFGFGYWLFCLPNPLFRAPLSTELLSTEGELLSARIAEDGQWRMPAADSISPKLATAVIVYEDRRFHRHWGISVAGIVRAVRDNWRAGRVVSGASTLTMQVARMARGNRPRTLWQKLIEGIWATRLEVRYSKEEILDFWLANAPFGGNAVGAEAATRRYYGRSPANLSWGEAATLAVLPNSPGLIHPGRSRTALQEKRDGLLDDLAEAGYLDRESADLAKLEPLPDAPYPLPRSADHLLERLRIQYGAGRYTSSLEANLQQRLNDLVERHHDRLVGNEVHNVAATITEVATGRVLAYVGNVPNLAPAFAPDVDIVTAPRSSGSLLKPILYALAQEEGRLAARQLMADVPTSFNDFQPANFYNEFDGAVPADEALARSLNIPFVFLLREYGVPRFHAALREYGFRQISQPPDHYGLSLILGGGEVTLEEITTWFLGIARQQRYYYERQGQYARADFLPPTLLDAERRAPLAELSRNAGAIGAGAGWKTLQAMLELNRPNETGGMERFSSHRPVAWKTGTSFGYRDAWAVGCTPEYVVGVWNGNADGEGRAGLVGVGAAAPLLFRILRLLEERPDAGPNWFEAPFDDLILATTCQQSGFLAGPDCPTQEEWLARNAERGAVCNYHQRIFLEPSGQWQVRQDCGPGPASPTTWFELPARQAWFYRRKHSDYQALPPLHPDCGGNPRAPGGAMAFLYPHQDGALSPSKNWTGAEEGIYFELAHPDDQAKVHWHLDEQYLATTETFHSLSVRTTPGQHSITVVDDAGQRLVRHFTVR